MMHALAALLANGDTETDLERFQRLQDRLRALGWADLRDLTSNSFDPHPHIALMTKAFSSELLDVGATAKVELQRAAAEVDADIDAVVQAGPNEPYSLSTGQWR